MPIGSRLAARLERELPAIVEHFGTPFHLYDEAGISETVERLLSAFAGTPFREYYAVKALPNPAILRLLREHGCGFECASVAELELSRMCGAGGEDVFFTSNNTLAAEFDEALALDAIVNVDDITMLRKLARPPSLISFRFNPGAEAVGEGMIGKPLEAKFGVRRDQLVPAYAAAQALGATRFGLHAMVASNVLEPAPLLATLTLLLELEQELHAQLGIACEFLNMGGGLGTPYRPGESPLNLAALGAGAVALLDAHAQRTGRRPALFVESGRHVTGPHGVLVTRVVNRMSKWREYAGVDAGMAALMRPAMYPGAYHHVTLLGDDGERPLERVDVVGGLCENNDKFAIQRELPALREGDVLLIHDTGAHGIAMGFNYNGKLKPQELLLRADGSVELIRRAEEIERDYFSTLRFEANVLAPQAVRA